MSEHAHAESHHSHVKAYVFVFLALMVATVLTVVTAWYLQVGRVPAVTIAIFIAMAKACLVAWIFMHLKDDVKVFTAIATVPLVLFLIVVFLLLPDVGLAVQNPQDIPGHEEQQKWQKIVESAPGGGAKH